MAQAAKECLSSQNFSVEQMQMLYVLTPSMHPALGATLGPGIAGVIRTACNQLLLMWNVHSHASYTTVAQGLKDNACLCCAVSPKLQRA